MATSTPQTIPLVELYDYVLAAGSSSSGTTSKGMAGKRVKVTLAYDRGVTAAPDAPVWVANEPVHSDVIDPNGFWHVFLTPNNRINPLNTYYLVQIEGYAIYKVTITDVGVPAMGWQSSAAGVLLDIPTSLSPATSSVGAITASGLLTAQAGVLIAAGGLSVTGGVTDVGGLTVDSITYSTAVSRLIAGATSFAVRNTANSADNLLVTDAGNVTVRGGLAVNGASGLTVSTVGQGTEAFAAITGDAGQFRRIRFQTGGINRWLLFTNTTGEVGANSGSDFQLDARDDAGVFLGTAISIVRATRFVTIPSGLGISSGGLSITAGTLQILNAPGLITMGGVGTAGIAGGTTGLIIYNNAINATNLGITDAGLATLRNALQFPPSAAGAIAPTAYASTRVKIAELAGDGTTNAITFSGIPTNFRTLILELFLRATNAATFNDLTVQLNGDTTAVYDWERALISGASLETSTQGNLDTSLKIGHVNGATAPANAFAFNRIAIANANSTTMDKNVTCDEALALAYSAGNIYRIVATGIWHNAVPAAVTSIKLITSAGFFAATSVAVLYGDP